MAPSSGSKVPASARFERGASVGLNTDQARDRAAGEESLIAAPDRCQQAASADRDVDGGCRWPLFDQLIGDRLGTAHGLGGVSPTGEERQPSFAGSHRGDRLRHGFHPVERRAEFGHDVGPCTVGQDLLQLAVDDSGDGEQRDGEPRPSAVGGDRRATIARRGADRTEQLVSGDDRCRHRRDPVLERARGVLVFGFEADRRSTGQGELRTRRVQQWRFALAKADRERWIDSEEFGEPPHATNCSRK